MLQTRKIFVFAEVQRLSNGVSLEHSLVIGSFDYREYESVKDQYVFICEREISFEIPDDVASQAAEAMEVQLSEIRAKHYAEQQKIIDSIAKLRQLAAPVEGQLMDDTGLTERAKVIDSVAAEDAEFNDLPF